MGNTICKLPDGIRIDPKISLIDLARQDHIEFDPDQDRLPRDDHPIPYAPVGIRIEEHPLGPILQGRSREDFNHYLERLVRFDGRSQIQTGTITGRMIRQYIARKNATAVENWSEEIERDWDQSAWLLTRLYAKWCHPVPDNQAPAGGNAATVTLEIAEVFPEGGPAAEPPPPVPPPEPPNLWQLTWNFLVDRPEMGAAVAGALALGLLWLVVRSRRPIPLTRRVVRRVPQNLAHRPPAVRPPAAARGAEGTVRLPSTQVVAPAGRGGSPSATRGGPRAVDPDDRASFLKRLGPVDDYAVQATIPAQDLATVGLPKGGRRRGGAGHRRDTPPRVLRERTGIVMRLQGTAAERAAKDHAGSLATDNTVVRRFRFFEEQKGIFLHLPGRKAPLVVTLRNYTEAREELVKAANAMGENYNAANPDAVDLWRAHLATVRRYGDPWDFPFFPLLEGRWGTDQSFRVMVNTLTEQTFHPTPPMSARELEEIRNKLWERYCELQISPYEPAEVLDALAKFFSQIPSPITNAVA